MDVTHVPCGADGWGHLTAVIDCHDREVTGFEFALRGRAKEAERALEEACLARFGTLRPDGPTPVMRSDNGLIFQSRRFRAACRDYRLRQEFITPYTPEQNGLIERFFRSLKEECVWLHNFGSFAEARTAITQLDRMVQRRTASPGPRLSQPASVSRATTPTRPVLAPPPVPHGEKEMAKLTTKVRKKLPATDFGEPKKHAYPMPDKAHAINAKARAAQMVKKGKLTASEKKAIDGRANRKLATKAT